MSDSFGASPQVWSWWGWEPLSFYLDGQDDTTTIHGLTATQLRQWWSWLHDEQTVAQAAAMGVTWIVTHYTKGYGLEAEATERAQTAELVKRCHRHGIRVIGYVQYGTIFHRTFFQEHPEASTWIQRDEHGDPMLWWGDKRRYLPCVEADDYADYLKGCIRAALTDADLDGIHFDNFYAQHCHCDRCRKAFQQHIGGTLPSNEQMTADTQEMTLWTDWRAKRLQGRMDELQAYARSLKPDVQIIWNPSAIRGTLCQRFLRATDFLQLGRRAQMLWAESGNFPQVGNSGTVIHQVNLFKTARAIGYRAFSTAWQSRHEGLGLPDQTEMLTLQMAETVSFGAEVGNNWMMRPEYYGQFPNSTLCRHWTTLVDYVKRNNDTFFHNSDHAQVAVYFDTSVSQTRYSEEYGRFLTAQQLLLEEHIPFKLQFDNPKPADNTPVWNVTAGQWLLPDGTTMPLDVLNPHVDGVYSSAVSLDESAKRLAEKLKTLLENTADIRTDGLPRTVFLERRVLADDKRHMLQLVNYDWKHPVATASMTFLTGTPETLEFQTPDTDSWQTLTAIDGSVFKLPAFAIWATLRW